MKKKLIISYNAPVILAFVILCFLATVIGLLTGNKSTEILFSVYRSPLTSPFTYLRCFTHVFGHIGLDHFLGNAMYLLLIGPLLEEKYSSKVMVKVIVVTALITGIVHCILWGNATLCGASGVVFACIMLSSFTAFNDGEIPLSFLLVAVFFIGREIYSGIAVRDNISNLTHILGGVVGCVAGYSLNKRR